MKISRVSTTAFNSIDVIKVCMSVLVVAIHTTPEKYINNEFIRSLIQSIYFIAVPFFFVTSGFLVWNKILVANKEDKLKRLKKWIKKTARLYVAWSIIYIPFTIYGFWSDNVGWVKSIVIFLRNIVLVGQNYLSWPLWYLLAMLVAGCILYIMISFNWRNKAIYIVAILLALLGALINYCDFNGIASQYMYIYIKVFNTTRNGFFEGFPYIIMGVFIASKGVLSSKKILLSILIISFGLHVAGVEFAKFVVVYSLFSLVIQIDLKSRSDNLYKNMRLTSTIVYFVHMIYVGLVVIFCPIKIDPVILFIGVVLMSFLTSFMAIGCKETQIVKLLFR